MQTAHLRTLLAVKNTGSFTAAAAWVHLSHSAVSIQMKHLEQAIGAPLFEKNRRPAVLTPIGEEIAEKAREVVDRLDDMKSMGDADDVTGRVALGFVSTTLQTLLPVVLARLRRDFPELQVAVHSGLSGQLANSVETHQVDFAFLSAPVQENPMVRMHEIGSEPLFLVTSKTRKEPAKIGEILRQNPFISFDRSTWLGEQIASHLAQRGLFREPDIELDSIDAIEHLVELGFGVSILPQRLLAPPLDKNLRLHSLGQPAPMRRVMLAAPQRCRRQTLLNCLIGIAAGVN